MSGMSVCEKQGGRLASRLDVRCDSRMPVTVALDSQSAPLSCRAVTLNVGLRGAFINAPLPFPDQAEVTLRTNLEGRGELEINGKIVRREENGAAIKFVSMEDDARSRLWEHIRENLYDKYCPYCGVTHPSNNGKCMQCGRNIDFSAPLYLDEHESEVAALWLEALNGAMHDFNLKMKSIESRFEADPQNRDVLQKETTSAIYEVCDVCSGFEEAMGGHKGLVKRKQVELREKTDFFFSKSYFMNRARTWPQGYPGDYKLLDGVYRNVPLSGGVGHLLDLHFLSAGLAVAVRGRLEKIKEILGGELRARNDLGVFNIACGSSREIFELAGEIKGSRARITCVDYDPDALDFAMNRLAYAEMLPQLDMRRYNAVRMVNREKNLKEFGPQDFIYSMGLFNYLPDNLVVSLVSSLHDLLNPGGKLVIAFEDVDRYRTQEYHWFVDWDSLLQRNERDGRDLFARAGIPEAALRVVRDRSGVIMFFVVEKG